MQAHPLPGASWFLPVINPGWRIMEMELESPPLHSIASYPFTLAVRRKFAIKSPQMGRKTPANRAFATLK